MATLMTTVKKRKIDGECRIFKGSWTNDFFVIEHNEVILCLICQEKIAVFKEYNVKRHYSTRHARNFDMLNGQMRLDRVNSLKQNMIGQQSFFKAARQSSEAATKVSFLISEAIAKRGKPLSDGDFVKDCLDIFTSVVCPDKKSMVEKTSLSSQTVARRVDDLAANIQNSLIERLGACQFYSLAIDESTDVCDTAQLAIFIRGVTKGFEVVEELLDLCSMKGTTTGQDIFDEIKHVMMKFEKLCGITTDGAPAMIGKHKGFTSLMRKYISHEVITHHRIIHQQQLCAKTLEMKHVMERVVYTVNFIRSKGLNFLTEVGSDHDDVIYFSHVRWLSRAATLARFCSLIEEIKFFMKSKEKDVSFMEDDQWLNDLAFLVDITKYLAEFNVKLKGKEQCVNKLYEHVQAFIQKFELIHAQLINKKVVHFTTLSTMDGTTVKYEKYSALIGILRNEFEKRFADFREHCDELKLFSDPFRIDVNDAHAMFQLELIDIQSDSDLKRAFAEHDLQTFYRKYVTSASYSNLSQLALRLIALIHIAANSFFQE